MQWQKVQINSANGMLEGIAPLIISASRATDIPAFHAAWFLQRVRAGYVKWTNPFNQRTQFVSFQHTRAIIFWSKNPAPLLPFLPELDALQIPYYFQFTVNDYDDEQLEPAVPCLEDRLLTFQRLAECVGKHRVIWRFDPLILAAGLEPSALIAKVAKVGASLHPYTEKLVFSFADISSYAKVGKNLQRAGIPFREFTLDEMREIAREIAQLCQSWGISAATCAEAINLTDYGIEKNKCIDDALLLKITQHDPALVKLFSVANNCKDPGQRKACGCVYSKDIGQYNSCLHQCVYCYANANPAAIKCTLSNE